MDGVASAFAVISLAVQLVDTVQEIRDFLRSVQNAPNELIKLVETLEQLHGTLNQVKHLLKQQYSILRLPGSPVFMENALQNCSRKISTLEKVVNEAKNTLARQSRVKRTLAVMKLVSKKEDLQKMQSQLLHAEMRLQTAMLSNSWQLQMHHISIAKSSAHQAVAIDEASLTLPATTGSQHDKASSQFSYTSENSILKSTKETYFDWYRGLFGFVVVQTKSKAFKRSASCRNDNRAVVNETIIKVKPSFMRQLLELRLANNFGRISRTLSMYHVLEPDAPIFKLCKDGDLRGLQVALSSGGVSPFALDGYGQTLLHYAARYFHTELCGYLLRIGVDPDHRNDFGEKAIAEVGLWSCESQTEEPLVDTLRLLIRNQDDMSLSDLDAFYNNYWGPVEGTEFIFKQYLIQYENPHNEVSFPPLAAALSQFGGNMAGWDPFLRLLIRTGAGLHAPVQSHVQRFLVYPCPVPQYGSPLDELFFYTKTPFEGEKVARHWLQILEDEGYNTLAYLKEEFELRAANMQLTYPAAGITRIPRQLKFHWGSSPYVSWDWWIDPDSPVSMVCEEFKHIALSSPVCRRWEQWEGKWKNFWPFTYSASRLGYSYLDGQNTLYERAQERFNRRAKKRSKKLACAQSFRSQSKMPGAWPV